MSGWAALASVVSDALSAQSARDAMQFQEHGQRHAYRNAAKDLEAAGLNRVLALGNPAQAPSPVATKFSNPADSYYSAKQAEASIDVAKAQEKNLESQASANEASAAKARADTLSTIELLPFQKQQLNSASNAADAQALSSQASAGLSDANALLAHLEGDKQKVLKSLYTEFGPMIVDLVKSVREMFSNSKDANVSSSGIIDKLFGFDAFRQSSGKVSAHEAENIAISVIQSIETGKLPRIVLTRLSGPVRSAVFDMRPEWRKGVK